MGEHPPWRECIKLCLFLRHSGESNRNREVVSVYILDRKTPMDLFIYLFRGPCFDFSNFTEIQKQQVRAELHTNLHCYSVLLPVIAGSSEGLSYGASCLSECAGE